MTLCDPWVRGSSVSRVCPGSPRCLFPVRMQSTQNVREGAPPLDLLDLMRDVINCSKQAG